MPTNNIEAAETGLHCEVMGRVCRVCRVCRLRSPAASRRPWLQESRANEHSYLGESWAHRGPHIQVKVRENWGVTQGLSLLDSSVGACRWCS